MKITIEFEKDLNKFLPIKKRNQKLLIDFMGKRSVKDLIQSLGIPQTEVGGIKVNNQWVGFSYILRDKESILVFSVSPVAETPENPLFKIKNKSGNLAFICDVHLKKLARGLRLLGFDTRYNPSWKDVDLADMSYRENLILLTRDRGLLMRKKACCGIFVSNTEPEKQVCEVVQRLRLGNDIKPFSRCLVCNGMLEKGSIDEKTKALIPPKVLEWTNDFQACPACKKIFWKGTHYEKLKEMIKKVLP